MKDVGCSICGMLGHVKATCRRGEEDKLWEASPKPLSGRRCYNCNEFGHESHDCPKPKQCSLCFDPSHQRKDCPFKDTKCTVCMRKGHLLENCPRLEAKREE